MNIGNMRRWVAASSILGAAALLYACGGKPEEKSLVDPATLKPNDWLLSAKDDAERFSRIQEQFRGFDTPMWEVGERYRSMFDALKLNNKELARYHWKKIRTAIENGIAKRPARAANANAMLLDSTWADVDKSLSSDNSAERWAGFERARATCMACHASEEANGGSAEIMNNQPLFIDTAPPYTQ